MKVNLCILFWTIVLFLPFSCHEYYEINKKPLNPAKEAYTKSIQSAELDEKLAIDYFKVSESAAKLFMEIISDRRWSVSPYVSAGDTLFYIFNGENGWKIVSGDTRTSAILAESPSGSLIVSEQMDLPLQIIIQDAIQTITSFKSCSDVKEQPYSGIWNIVNRIVNQSYKTNYSKDAGFHWVKVLYSSSFDTTNVETIDHLLSTTWDQESPWNAKTPIAYNTHCLAGCAAVTIGQMMYYFNQLSGYPSGLYESVALQSGTPNRWQQIVLNDYNAYSTRWNSMSLNREDGLNTGYVADLLAYIGHDLHMDYGIDVSTVPSFYSSLLPQFGLRASDGQFGSSYENAITNLRDNTPVMAVSFLSNNHSLGHVWIIDGYMHERIENEVIYKYYYVDDPSSLNGMYNGYPIVSVYDDEEMSYLCPGYVNGAQTVDTAIIDHRFFLMNWGVSNGVYDNIRQDINYWIYKQTSPINYNRRLVFNLEPDVN